MTTQTTLPPQIISGLASGHVIPYFGPGVLDLIPGGSPVPAAPEALAAILTAKVTVPHKIRNRLTAAAQFIENFKHRKTLTTYMREAFAPQVTPSSLHTYFASLPNLPLWVDAWYDDATQNALAGRNDWGQVQGLSQSEHFGTWTGYYDAAGQAVTEADAAGWNMMLYKPIGSSRPAGNFLISDTDYVEVLTEIDIQTPIPAKVQELRTGRHFLFLGCRFNDQLQRTFARQVMKRSSDHHWAVLPGELTRNELRFLEEQNIQHIDMPLEQFVALLTDKALEVHS
ncbi:SIR2 family NAD-dependent protein deacylase [Sulfuriferula nivalis]|uniref:Transcriptional regulator n=1 Tax=Sulfuriferula nivalis TaxID=2675298 RepID=A0A809SG69_9PROT|nr:SIR2 family protein [Sulfuriferula nivalis]BBO99669.1 transcriptional regulator [Sulfuriferula nivalis]